MPTCNTQPGVFVPNPPGAGQLEGSVNVTKIPLVAHAALPFRLTPRFSRYAHADSQPTPHEWFSDLRFEQGEHSACHCGEGLGMAKFHVQKVTHA